MKWTPDLVRRWLDALRPMALQIANGFDQVRRKPLIGGLFGSAGFYLASYNTIGTGLDVPFYMVIHQSGMLLSSCPSKAEAIEFGRSLLRELGPHGIAGESAVFERLVAADREERKRIREEAWAQRATERPIAVKSVPRRRRLVYDGSSGKCHYCGTALTLDGRWHIEHKMPRALLGGSEQSNLVASCVTCNLKKKDKTDLEFKSQLAQGAAA